eukprot:12551468-Ditylum_brightwellii.AAC.1
MDNWFTSKPLYNEMMWLGEYPYGTMEVKRYVSPFLKHGKTKKPTIAVPKGTIRAGTSVDGKLSICSFMDSSIVYILDSVYSGRMEDYTRMNKTTGIWEINGKYPKALNEFNNT